MKWEEIGEQPCSVARTLSVLGDRWTMLILRNAFMGIRRFDDFQRSLGLTRHVLSERLKRLVEHEILVKVPYVERQERFEYQLTEKGLDLKETYSKRVKYKKVTFKEYDELVVTAIKNKIKMISARNSNRDGIKVGFSYNTLQDKEPSNEWRKQTEFN